MRRVPFGVALALSVLSAAASAKTLSGRVSDDARAVDRASRRQAGLERAHYDLSNNLRAKNAAPAILKLLSDAKGVLDEEERTHKEKEGLIGVSSFGNGAMRTAHKLVDRLGPARAREYARALVVSETERPRPEGAGESRRLKVVKTNQRLVEKVISLRSAGQER
jgi:hypothetical protein